MILVDEVNETNVFRIQSEELMEALHSIKSNEEEKISTIKEKINKYEQKRRSEEVMYRSLSPIKKLFTSHAPSHHQAVEYMVYVKERFKSIEKIKQKVSLLDRLSTRVQSAPNNEEIFLSGILMEEIKAWKEAEVRQK
jgi:hypothetical protein